MASADNAIWIWRYTLRARGFLNSLSSRREFHGALICYRGGYGCLQPWPELGDPSLESCLKDLAGPCTKQLVRRCLRCAEYDGAARRAGVSLFDDLEVPLSHATLTSLDAEEVARAEAAGFNTCKLKSGTNLKALAVFLNAIAQQFPQMRWRIDCNEQFAAEEVSDWFAQLDQDVTRRIDFLEDPCPYHPEQWQHLGLQLGVPLALDRQAQVAAQGAEVLVAKPYLDDPMLLAEWAKKAGKKFIMTSAMDHALGQSFAAWEAARCSFLYPGLVGLCGLRTDQLFVPDSFFAELGAWGPQLVPAAGTGLGFDDLLKALPWTRLH